MRTWQAQLRAARTRGGAAPWTPPAGMLGWWYGNDLTSGAWTDRTGNGFHATLYNTPTLGANGLTLDGVNQWASIAEELDDAASALTVCAWVYCDTRTGVVRTVLANDYTSGARIRAALAISQAQGWTSTAGYMGAGLFDGSAWRAANDTAICPLATWVHFAGTYTTNQIRIYRDGALIATATPTFALPADTGRIWKIGRRWDNTGTNSEQYWDGSITDLMVLSGVADAETIADIYANSPGRPV